MHLILPSAAYERSYNAYIDELGDEVRYPFPLDFDHSDFRALLQRLEEFRNGVNLPEGYVPCTTYWLVDGRELVGVSNLRPSLSEKLRHVGGHIGLGIRPSRRGQGLGKLLMQLTVKEAQRHGLTTLRVHCHKHNVPSSRMIIANGGVLESEVLVNNDVVQRYTLHMR